MISKKLILRFQSRNSFSQLCQFPNKLYCTTRITLNSNLNYGLSTELVTSFPQLKLLNQLQNTGKYPEAVEIVENTHKILANATGKSSEPTKSLNRLLQSLQFKLGDYQKLELRNIDETKRGDKYSIDSLLVSSLSLLQSFNLNAALTTVDSALEICENQMNEIPNEKFGLVYGLKGLSPVATL
jgi:hypothetical protein